MDPQPSMFKLNINCFNDIFDYLSLGDLRQVSQTCKTLKEVVGQYFEMNYGTIQWYAGVKVDHLRMSKDTVGISDFIRKLYIFIPREPIPLDRIRPGISEDDDPKRDLNTKIIEISFDPNGLTEVELHRIQFMINHAEELCIMCEFDEMSRPVYEIVPDMCHNLKRLYMRNFGCEDRTIKQTGNKWLLREYPKLVHLEWSQSEEFGHKIDEIKTFFERNPNVRSFVTNHNNLWASRHLILESGVKLDDLTIEIYEEAESIMPEVITQVCNLLNEFYTKGVYKRLHFEFKEYRKRHIEQKYIEQHIDQLIPLHVVKSLCLSRDNNVDLSKLTNIVELKFQISSALVMPNVELMAKQLVNLERIDIGISHDFLKEMLPFIYHSLKLKKMRVARLRDENVTFLDLAALNAEREKLSGARKLTIFIEEKIYLETKWRMNGRVFSLIEVRRETSHKWGHHFQSV